MMTQSPQQSAAVTVAGESSSFTSPPPPVSSPLSSSLGHGGSLPHQQQPQQVSRPSVGSPQTGFIAMNRSPNNIYLPPHQFNYNFTSAGCCSHPQLGLGIASSANQFNCLNNSQASNDPHQSCLRPDQLLDLHNHLHLNQHRSDLHHSHQLLNPSTNFNDGGDENDEAEDDDSETDCVTGIIMKEFSRGSTPNLTTSLAQQQQLAPPPF